MFTRRATAAVCFALTFTALAAIGSATTCLPAEAADKLARANSGPTSAEPTANSLQVPRQILRTGINLNTLQLSPNSMQVSDIIELTPVLARIEHLRAQGVNTKEAPTADNMAQYVSLVAAKQQAQRIISSTNLAVDFVTAEINAEQALYSEILATLQAKADKKVQWANWGAYYSNGALWAVAEALDIPTWKRPKYAIGSGINGIIAGVIPSIASVYGMHAANGSKYQGEADANMLAKVLNAKTNSEVEYPSAVWAFLSAAPADDPQHRARKDQLIDRWIADSNMPSFTDRSAQEQLDIISGVTDKKKAISISVLQTRMTMLTQLAAEVSKMKRMLYELSLAIDGEKQLRPQEAMINRNTL